MSRTPPPRLAGLLLRLALDPEIAEQVLGDLEEEFAERAAREGRFRARRWYWKQALTSSAKGRRAVSAFRPPRHSHHPRIASPMDSVAQDFRLTLRSFANNPGFTAVAVATLALGIGATTGVFSIADWLMLRPVPGVAGQERLAFVQLGILQPGGGLRVSRLSYPNLNDFAGRLTQVDGFAGFQSSSINASAGNEGAVSLPTEFVTASYADVLGLEPQLGRWFSAAEDDPAATAHVAVISDATWRGMYGGDPGVIGRDLLVNGRPFQIVGVAAAGFEGAQLRGGVGAWLPGSAYPWANHYEEVMDYAQRDSGGYYEFVARAAEQVGWEQVRAELAAAAGWLAERYPEDNEKFAPSDGSPAVAFHVYPGIGPDPLSLPYIRSTVRLMLGVVALVLLVACANVANLLLVRGTRRAGDFAVRTALGARRSRLVRQQLMEGLLLWMLGGSAGLIVATLLARSFAGAQIGGGAVVASVPLDVRMLVFSCGLALFSGVAFSLLPAWVVSRVDPARTLQSGTDGSRGRRSPLRLLFGAAQIGASLTLLVGALLLNRTVDNMARVDPGIDPTDITAAALSPTNIGLSVDGAAAYFRTLREGLAAHPATTGVALSTNVPFYGFKSYSRARAADDPDVDYIEPLMHGVTEAYFDLLSIPLVKGRAFTAEEVRTGAQVMVISRSLAAALFGDTEPLGRSIEVPQYRGDSIYYPVVGVVADTRFHDLTAEPEPAYYTPLGQGPEATRAVVLLETRPDADGGEVLRSAITAASPSLAPGRIESLEQSVRDATAQPRMMARLLALLAGVAAALSAVGLYAMMSTATAQRRFELGLRMALGSSPRGILRLVLTSTVPVTSLGVAVGLFGAWSLSRAIESRLYGVVHLDPTAWIAAVLLLGAVAFVAALVPARRASRLDPVDTLRSR